MFRDIEQNACCLFVIQQSWSRFVCNIQVFSDKSLIWVIHSAFYGKKIWRLTFFNMPKFSFLIVLLNELL